MADGTARPQRATEIIEQIVDDELVIYNLANDDVHLLNTTTAAVWRHCDGDQTVDDIARATGFDTEIVWAALQELDRSNLLQETVEGHSGRISRRQLMRRIAIGAVAIPVVTSIVAPTAAAAASAGCTSNTDCGGGQSCVGGQCCVGAGGRPPGSTCLGPGGYDCCSGVCIPPLMGGTGTCA